MATFGSRLRLLRKERKLLQDDIANVLGVVRSTITMYEKNMREPTFKNIKDLADFFDVSIDYLMGRSNTRVSNYQSETDVTKEIEDVGKRIQQIRKSTRLSRAEFANKIGISIEELTEYEEGKKLPVFEIQSKISNIGSIDPSELLIGVDTEISIDNNIMSKEDTELLRDIINKIATSNDEERARIRAILYALITNF